MEKGSIIAMCLQQTEWTDAKLKIIFFSGHLAKGEAYWILFLEQNLPKIKVGMMDVFDV